MYIHHHVNHYSLPAVTFYHQLFAYCSYIITTIASSMLNSLIKRFNQRSNFMEIPVIANACKLIHVLKTVAGDLQLSYQNSSSGFFL